MSTQAIQAGEAFIQLNIKSDEFQKGLLDIGKKLEGVGSDVKKFTSLMSQNFKSISQSIQPIAPMIELTGFSFNAFAPAISLVENLTIAFQQNIAQIAALVTEQGFAAAANKVFAGTLMLSSTALEINATVMKAHPLMWIVGIIIGATAALNVIIRVIGNFTDYLANNAKAADEACKRNESYIDSAKKSLDVLKELSTIDPWQSDKKAVSLSSWKELQKTTEKLGISLNALGLTFNEQTGKLDLLNQSFDDPTEKTEALAKATAKLREAKRVKELNDLNTAIQAQEKYLDSLQSKLNDDGKVGWTRWIGTYVSFGYVDNAEEIQKKIDEESQKLQENQDKRKTVVDFSAEYKENEAKLKEMYDKEAEASKNALAVKIDNIKTEFSEREAILRQLIHEAEVRDSLSFEDMEKLRERRAALAGLNAEQEKRIQLLRDEQAEKYPLQDVTA